MDGILASHPVAPGSNPSIAKTFSKEILKLPGLINSTAYNSGQRLDDVDQTHRVASLCYKKLYVLKYKFGLGGTTTLALRSALWNID